MTPQIFILNVPSELTTWGSNGVEVICRANRDDDGNLLMVHFLDVETKIMITVKDWFSVWEIAMVRADELWTGKTESKTIAEIFEEENDSQYLTHQIESK